MATPIVYHETDVVLTRTRLSAAIEATGDVDQICISRVIAVQYQHMFVWDWVNGCTYSHPFGDIRVNVSAVGPGNFVQLMNKAGELVAELRFIHVGDVLEYTQAASRQRKSAST